jgi:hypothetical protein
LLVEEDAEPFGSVFVGSGEGEGTGGNFTAVTGDGESDFAEAGGVAGADEVDRLGPFAIDPFAVDGIEGPGAIESQAAGGADAGFGDRNGIEGFDRVETDVDEARGGLRKGHMESLAEAGNDEVRRETEEDNAETQSAQSSEEKSGMAGPVKAFGTQRTRLKGQRSRDEGREG